MHDVLIALQDTLASRIALRYARDLEASDQFNIQAIHIPEIKAAGPAPGSGWVREKWENALVEDSREEMTDLIQKEYLFHFSDSGLKTIAGPEDQVILGELEDRPYDLFIEGRLHAFEPEPFKARLASRLYRDTACPVLMVKNRVNPDRGTLVLSRAGSATPWVSSWLDRLLSGLPGSLDVLSCRFNTGKAGGSAPPKPEVCEAPGTESPWQGIHRFFEGSGTPEALGQWAAQYALVVAPLPSPNRSPHPAFGCRFHGSSALPRPQTAKGAMI